MGPSDSPATYMSGVQRLAFPNRPPPPSDEGVAWVSRFSRVEYPRVLGVCDSAALKGGSQLASPFMWPSPCQDRVGTPEV
jgi:hypothetical protein